MKKKKIKTYYWTRNRDYFKKIITSNQITLSNKQKTKTLIALLSWEK